MKSDNKYIKRSIERLDISVIKIHINSTSYCYVNNIVI